MEWRTGRFPIPQTLALLCFPWLALAVPLAGGERRFLLETPGRHDNARPSDCPCLMHYFTNLIQCHYVRQLHAHGHAASYQADYILDLRDTLPAGKHPRAYPWRSSFQVVSFLSAYDTKQQCIHQLPFVPTVAKVHRYPASPALLPGQQRIHALPLPVRNQKNLLPRRRETGEEIK